MNTDDVSTSDKKDVRINFKVKRELREEFEAAAIVLGARSSTLLHQYIVKVVREEKARDPTEFKKALVTARERGRERAAKAARSATRRGDEVRMTAEAFESMHEEVSKRAPGAAAKRKAGARKR